MLAADVSRSEVRDVRRLVGWLCLVNRLLLLIFL